METTPLLFDARMSTRDAAGALGVHSVTLLRWVGSGYAVPAEKINGGFVFTGTEVERLAALDRPKRGRPRKDQAAA